MAIEAGLKKEVTEVEKSVAMEVKVTEKKGSPTK